jgi:hypothetical protein
MALWGLLIGCLWLSWAAVAMAADTRNVLMLFSNGRLLPANVEFDRGMSEVFAAHPESRVDLSVEFLDAPKFGGAAYDRTWPPTCAKSTRPTHPRSSLSPARSPWISCWPFAKGCSPPRRWSIRR